jgi:transposase
LRQSGFGREDRVVTGDPGIGAPLGILGPRRRQSSRSIRVCPRGVEYVRYTATWLFSIRPAVPVYWRCPPLTGDVLAQFVPDPGEIIGKGTALVDGTICPTWDWSAIPDLFSGKAGYPGMNVQIATDLDGQIVAISTTPVHGARHDAHAASGLADALADLHTVADLGYVGVDGIDLVPTRKPKGHDLHPDDATFNTELSAVRATVERAVAHLKTWRMLSEEGGRYRAPIDKYASMLQAIIGLLFFSRAYE